MKRVIVESPYAAETDEEIALNVKYARAAIRDCLMRGEAPIASHLLYTQEGVLDDKIPEERRHGMEAGLAWRHAAEATIVYTDRGISAGMKYGIQDAQEHGRPIEYRNIEGHKE